MQFWANKTRNDAFRRLVDARMGSVADATEEYLQGLRGFLFDWIEEIENAQLKLAFKDDSEGKDDHGD